MQNFKNAKEVLEKYKSNCVIIVGVDDDFGIGKGGVLPFSSKLDMKFFKDTTTGNTIIMGANTWLDPKFPGPLPNRKNIVLTNKSKDLFIGADVISGDVTVKKDEIKAGKEVIKIEGQLFCIGGANVYHQFADKSKLAFVTRHKGSYNCDTFFNILHYKGFKKIGEIKLESLSEELIVEVYKK